MVRTRPRGPAPDELTSNQREWTERWKRRLEWEGKIRWALPRDAKGRVREALVSLTHGKCAFCERWLGDSTWAAIEHYHSKTIYQDLAFEWTNLLPACSVCNGMKSNQDHHGDLLKPDEEDPEPFFWLDVGTGRLEPHPRLTPEQTVRAKTTIDVCDLQRPVLCKRRFEMVKRVGKWIEAVSRQMPLSRSDREEWRNLSDPSTEHKFVLRFMLESRKLALRVRADRKRFRME